MDPTLAIQTLFQQANASVSQLPPNSRYVGIETATYKLPDGRIAVYFKRRFVPSPDRFALLQIHTVTQDERIDNVTAQYLGDPEQFWRICDANAALFPPDLTATPGAQIRITLPEGIPGPSNA